MNQVTKVLKVMAGLAVDKVERISNKIKNNLTEEKQEQLIQKADETIEQAKQLGSKVLDATKSAGESAYEKIRQGLSDGMEKINEAIDKLNSKIDDIEKDEAEDFKELEDSANSEESSVKCDKECECSNQGIEAKNEEALENKSRTDIESRLNELLKQLHSIKDELSKLDENK